MNFIEIINVNKSFNDQIALKNVNLNITENSVIGVLGKSGSGKSVLINMLRGMNDYQPDTGHIIYNIAMCPDCIRVEPPSMKDKDCECGGKFHIERVDFWNCERTVFSAIRRRISIMLQRTFALYEDDTVIDNVLKALDNTDEESTYRAIELLEMTQMTHRITHIARDLSGGEKQRVVLARQMAKNPMLFLADEPTGTLDPQTAELLHETLLEGVKNRGETMVISSHWPEVMKKLSDYVIWLDKGEIIHEGNPDIVVQKFMDTVPEADRKEIEIENNPIISLENVIKHYYSIERGVVKAVDGVNLQINEGEISSIVGLSGAGKTTVSRMLCGLTEPSSGSINIKLGEEWIDMTERGPLGRGRVTPYIGLLHQEYSLYPHKTVLENLTDSISLELPAEFGKIKALHVLEAVGFEEEYSHKMFNKYPDELSGGERHRVALAQILIKEPKIVILDEPTGTMDPITRVQLTKSILRARDELNQTFIIISHDMDFVIDVCDNASLMRGGKILKTGRPNGIVKDLTNREKEKMIKKQSNT